MPDRFASTETEPHRLARPRTPFAAECVCGVHLVSADEYGEIEPGDIAEALADHRNDVEAREEADWRSSGYA